MLVIRRFFTEVEISLMEISDTVEGKETLSVMSEIYDMIESEK